MLTVTKLSSGNKLILSTKEVEIIQKTGFNPTEIIYTVSIKEQVSENLATILLSCGPRELLYVTSSVDPSTQFLIPFHKIKLIEPAGVNDSKIYFNGRSPIIVNEDIVSLATQIALAQNGAQGPQGIPGSQGPQGPQGVPGAVSPAGLNWQGAWSATGTYVVDDAIAYNGASYFCINPVGPSVTTPDIDTANWALLASQGSTGPQGPQGISGAQGSQGPQGVPGPVGPAGLNWQGVWSSSAIYTIDDAVSYNGASYFCINFVGPSLITPNVDLANWALLAAQGAIGPQGPQGVAGVQGPQGPAGPAGSGSGGFTHYLGEQYGGGIVFHVYKDPITLVEKCLILGPNLGIMPLTNVMGQWYTVNINDLYRRFYDGKNNTSLIVNQVGNTSGGAFAAYNLVHNGFNDWYIPSIDELVILYNNRFFVNQTLTYLNILIIGSIPIWSSTEVNINNAKRFDFNFGYEAGSTTKNDNSYCFAVRIA